MKKALMRSVVILLFFGTGLWVHSVYRRYAVSKVMHVPVTEYQNFEYPEDPANRSIHFGQYSKRALTLVENDPTHFDFLLDSTDPKVARIVFKNIDVSLMTPSEPAWTKIDPHLQRIALTDRQWNRQQVSFDPKSPHIEISGGDGFETGNIYSLALAKNCLNAGLWEILLFVQEQGQKKLYYHDWFRFPLGYYKDIFERNTGLSYWKHWYKLEHWSNPAGETMDLTKLRRVISERKVEVSFNPNEARFFEGEQIRKQRTTNAINIRTWGDIVRDASAIRFAAFIPPGVYSVRHPWKNEYWRFAHLDGAVVRKIISPASDLPLDEVELIFHGRNGQVTRVIVSGIDFNAIPQLPMSSYPKGLYMPMGIGVPPFFQSYAELEKHPPQASPYFSMLLDAQNRWVNHHEVAIDGPVMHRDDRDPALLHIYLLSYERHTLVGHYEVRLGGGPGSSGGR